MVIFLHASGQDLKSGKNLKEHIVKETRQTRAGQLFHGLIVSIMDDDGPKCVLNASELDETAILRMTVAGMTAFGMGEGSTHLNKLHGPLPIPEHPTMSYLAYYFRLSGRDSGDPRIRQFGRDAAIFLIFDNRLRNEIFDLYIDIERAFQNALNLQVTYKELIESSILLNVIERIKREIHAHQREKSLVSVTAGDKLKKKEQPMFVASTSTINQKIDEDIKELLEIQRELDQELTLTTEVPIVKDRKVEPNIDTRDKPIIDALRSRLFSWLDNHEKDLKLVKVRDAVDVDLLVRLGNWYFWYGLLLDSPEGFQKSIEAYLRASQFKKDPELWLAIGSSYIRLGNEDEGKSWIKEGFKKIAELQKHIPIDRKMLFAK